MIRQIILGVEPSIHEGVFRGAPTFRFGTDFALMQLRPRDRVHVVLQRRATTKAQKPYPPIDDPRGIATWLGRNRCMVTFVDTADVAAKRHAFAALVRAWIASLAAR